MFRSVIHHILRLPRAITIPAALILAIGLYALASGGGGRDAAAPKPAQAHQPAPAASVTHAEPPAPAKSANAASKADAATPPWGAGQAANAPPAAAADAGNLVTLLPGVQKPAGLEAMHAVYTLETETRNNSTPVAIGSRAMVVRTSAFSTGPIKSLSQFASKRADHIETWQWWYRATAEGQYLIALKAAGGRGQVSLYVDGSAAPAAEVQSAGNGAAVANASLDLGAGWHQARLVVHHYVRYSPGVQATVYMRGPAATTPATITPWAVTDAGKADAAPTELVPLNPAPADTAQSAAEAPGIHADPAAAVATLPASPSTVHAAQGPQQ